MNLREGSQLQGGKYIVERFISSGGFGCTYFGRHVLLKKRIAIKEFFVGDFCERDASTQQISVLSDSKRELVDRLRQKFLEEAQALSQLDHPSIVHVYDVFEENGTAYYVMDFIDGPSLSDMVKRDGPMAEATALKYIKDAGEALEYVHNKGRLHLDIKPANIMVNSNGRAILIDFGVSKQYDEAGGANTSTLLGMTPGYAAPEQMSNNLALFKPATDIYSLGATLYNLLGGGTPPGATELASGEELKPLPAGVSDSTRHAIRSSMQINRNMRPQSISEFLGMLSPATGTGRAMETSEPVNQPVTKANTKVPSQSANASQQPKADATVLLTNPNRYGVQSGQGGGDASTKSKMPLFIGIGVGVVALIVACVLLLSGSGASADATADATADTVVALKKVVDFEYTDNTGETIKYTGEVDAEGVPNGQGEGIYEYGTYKGAWSNGQPNGFGVYHTSDGKNSFEGEFQNFNYVEGTLHYNASGAYYKGTFKDDEPYDGEYFDSDNRLTHRYINGIRTPVSE